MSRIEDMIKTLCPEGVERVKLCEICEGITKGTLNMRSLPENGIYPVLNSGKEITGYNDKYNNDCEAITIASRGEYAGFVNYANGKFWAGILCYPFKLKENSQNLLRYIYYILKKNEVDIMSRLVSRGGIPALNKNDVENYKIPLPPLSIQQEIVSALDSFTTLIDKMKKEVELRKKQMECYCDKLYGGDFDGMMAMADKAGISVVTISELGTITRGKRFVRDDVRESGQPCIHYGDMYTYYGTKANKTKTFLDKDFQKKMRYAHKGDVVIVGAGENDYDIGVGLVWVGDEPAAVHDACYILEHKQDPMYISYYLRSNIYHQQLRQFVSSGKISSFSAEGLGKVYIPIQPLEKQHSIVRTLDAFDSYITKLEKLIALREKQYEYYREKLLTFE